MYIKTLWHSDDSMHVERKILHLTDIKLSILLRNHLVYCKLKLHRIDLFSHLLDEVVCRVIRPLLLLDCGGCRGNMDRSGDRSSHRGWWTSCDSCASTWLCLHCGSRGWEQTCSFERKFNFDTSALLVWGWKSALLFVLNTDAFEQHILFK